MCWRQLPLMRVHASTRRKTGGDWRMDGETAIASSADRRAACPTRVGSHTAARPRFPSSPRDARRACCLRGRNVFAIYAHLQPGSITVKPGQRVPRGEALGRIGNSGFSQGPHLHFQLANADGLNGEGIPYVLNEYDSFGINVGGKPVDVSKRHSVQKRFPAPDEVIAFSGN